MARLIGSSLVLLASLACGAGGAGEEGAGEDDGRVFRCDSRAVAGFASCSEYPSSSRSTGQMICDGAWSEGRCPAEERLGCCTVDAPVAMTVCTYRSLDPETYASVHQARRGCEGAFEAGAPTRSDGLAYPALAVDAEPLAAELTEGDDVRVVTGMGAFVSPYDVYRAELAAGQAYTVIVRSENESPPEIRDVRDTDPNGLDVQGLHIWGPPLEPTDSGTGERVAWFAFTAARGGAHAVMIEMGTIAEDGVSIEGVVRGPYRLELRTGQLGRDEILGGR